MVQLLAWVNVFLHSSALLPSFHMPCKHTYFDDAQSTVQKSEVSSGVLCIVDQTQQSQMLASMSIACDSSRIRMDCKIIGDMQADTGHDA